MRIDAPEGKPVVIFVQAVPPFVVRMIAVPLAATMCCAFVVATSSDTIVPIENELIVDHDVPLFVLRTTFVPPAYKVVEVTGSCNHGVTQPPPETV